MTLDSLSGTQKTSFRRKNRTKDDVSNVSLIEAWKIWFSGDLPADTILWGISILWWERIGKLMQVLGATTIIADIVGPEKIRQFGTSLQSTITSTTLIQFLKQCFDWYAVIFSQTILKEFANESPKARPERKFSQLDLLNYVICFFLTAWVTVSAQLYSFQWISLIEFIIIYVC